MASVLSFPSPDASLLSAFKHSDLNKKNTLFSEYLSELYDINAANSMPRTDPKDARSFRNKFASSDSNEVFLNSKLNQQYHLKHHETHLKTVTKLNDNSNEDELETMKQDVINSYLNDFNEFHRVQNINHKNRLSMYETGHSDQFLAGSAQSSTSSKTKRFSLNTFKTISKLGSRNEKRTKNSKPDRAEFKRTKSVKRNNSVKRNKSVSYKPIIGSHNIPLFRKKSTLLKVSNYAFTNTSFKDNNLTQKMFEVINTERLEILDKNSQVSKALLKRISETNYNKHSKIVNYASNIDLRSKFDRELLTKHEMDKLLELWQVYLKKIITLRIKQRLLNPVADSSKETVSDISSIAVNYQPTEFMPSYNPKQHISTPSSSSNGSSTFKAHLGVELSPLERKINEYIIKNRQHTSFATTADNTQFSNSYIHDKTHDTIYTDYK